MAGTVDMIADQGATFRRLITWRAGATPVPVDLSGYTARMHIRESVESTDFVVALTTENGRIELGGVDGTIDLFIDAATTAAVPAASYKYDLELVSGHATPEVTRLIMGKIKFVAEVTR